MLKDTPDYEQWRGKYEVKDVSLKLSLKQIAEQGHFSYAALKKWARRHGWGSSGISLIDVPNLSGTQTIETLGTLQGHGDISGDKLKTGAALAKIKSQRCRRFVQYMPLANSATQAAKDAGFPEKSAHVTACRLLKDTNIQEAIAETQQDIADRLGYTMERLVTEWDDLKQKCSEGTIIYDKMGNPLGASLFYPKGIVSSLENIGKLAGRYVEKRDVSLTGKLVVFAGDNNLID